MKPQKRLPTVSGYTTIEKNYHYLYIHDEWIIAIASHTPSFFQDYYYKQGPGSFIQFGPLPLEKIIIYMSYLQTKNSLVYNILTPMNE